jgi:hypothetical protein
MKNIIKAFFAFIFLQLIMQFSFAEEGSVARALILKGKVFYSLKDQEPTELKEGDSIPVGALLKTEDKSYTKILFMDKSSLTVGPNTQVEITSFPKEKAGIISLIKGQLRSRVTKDYMNIENKNQSKLFIKTKTAALGIRGTDFQVNYNEENQNSSLITFEGKVLMSSFDRTDRGADVDQNKLEEMVSGQRAVLVEGGHISAINNNLSERAMAPTLLGAKQFEALKNFEYGNSNVHDNQEVKFYRSPIPPGADGATFSAVKASEQERANGFFNSSTGEYKLPAGSIIDLKTVNIISPPVNAVYDANTKSYIVPEDFGKIDHRTGEYVPPKGLELEANGKFRVINTEVKPLVKEETKEDKKQDKKEEAREEKREEGSEVKKDESEDIISLVVEQEHSDEVTKNDEKVEQKSAEQMKRDEPKRDVASIEVTPPEIDVKSINIPKIYEGHQISDFANRFADVSLRSSVVAPETLGTVKLTEALVNTALDRKISTETVRQTEVDQGILLVPTKVNFKLNVK